MSRAPGRGYKFAWLALLWTLAFAAGDAWAQSAGAIAGTVSDTTGAVLPGVTVEAASPALIEGAKTVVTDGQGKYRIVDLRPGTYTLTFALSGFSAFRRDGIGLRTGFTATVDAQMQVGGLDETVTVTGESPLVDIQNTRVQTVLTEKDIDALPINRTITGFAVVTLGATGVVSGGMDVGGNRGENSQAMQGHGIDSNQMQKNVDGMNFNTSASEGGGLVSMLDVNQAAMQETVIETGANAESETGGIQLNYVPKDGGNRFSIYAAGTYTDKNLVSAALTDELIAAGLTRAGSVKKIYDISGGLGGPIRRDRVWFYLASRNTDAQEFQPETFWNRRINTVFYEPDRDAGLVWSYFPSTDVSARVTWQTAKKHRVTVSDSFQHSCLCRRADAATAPEASTHIWSDLAQIIQATWTFAATDRLLFQAGVGFGLYPMSLMSMDARDGQPGVDPATAISIFDSGLGITYGAVNRGGPANSLNNSERADNNYNQRFSAAYVTGTHSFKVGVQHVLKTNDDTPTLLNDISYGFLNQRPISLTLWNTPLEWKIRLGSLSVYAQDQWTIDRLTLNLGLRYDHFNATNRAGSLPERRYAPAFSWNEVEGVPDFHDLNARLGMAYDLFGTGKTAMKASLGRYVKSIGLNPYTFPSHPLTQTGASTNRTWTDLDGDFVPDCDQRNPQANGECGAYSNRNFGLTVPTTNFFLDDAIRGWGNRGYNWQTTVSLTHELVPGVAASANYYRTWSGNFLANDNTFVTPADHDEYCVTIPQDSRLPRSGQRLCGLYDIRPALFGQQRVEITQVSDFGEQTAVFNGVDVSVNARLARGAFLQGGVSFGRSVTDSCDAIVDKPAPEAAYCHVVPPWGAGSQVKLSGAFPLPWWGIQPSFTYQNLAGGAIDGNLTYTNAQIAPSLNRNLAAGAGGTVSVPIVAPQSLFLDRINQLDIRMTKLFAVGGGRFRAMLDVYNLLSARTILSVVSTYGSAWQRPTQAMPGRLFKLGGTLEF